MRAFAIIVLLAVACQHGVKSATRPPESPHQQAVPALARMTVMGEFTCTAWHIGGGQWITAGHCCDAARVDEADSVADLITRTASAVDSVYVEVQLDGEPANIVRRAESDDACVMHGPERSAYFVLAHHMPRFGSRVKFYGFPEGHFGVWEGLYVGDDEHSTSDGDVMFTAPVWGGASGSPLIDEDGYACGIVVSSFRGRPYSYAEPINSLRKFLGGS